VSPSHRLSHSDDCVILIRKVKLTRRYAANAILLPSLDMLSNLTPSMAPSILEHIMTSRPPSSPIWANWRGRYGLSESQQAAIWSSVDASREPVLEEKGEGVQLTFKTFEGEEKKVRGVVGENLLEVGKREGLPALEGVCGGHLGECWLVRQRRLLMDVENAQRVISTSPLRQWRLL
jgi:hypothetical protein